MNSNFVIVIGGIALLLLVLGAISSVADSQASRGDKTRWGLIVALLPVVGLVLWWSKGPKRA